MHKFENFLCVSLDLSLAMQSNAVHSRQGRPFDVAVAFLFGAQTLIDGNRKLRGLALCSGGRAEGLWNTLISTCQHQKH